VWLGIYLRGNIDKNLFIIHSCDNPGCCNPRHLMQGTALDNSIDMMSKGRYKYTIGIRYKGSSHHNSKLVERSILDIRYRYSRGGISQQRLADEYGVNQTIVSGIVRRKTWTHV